MSVPTDAKVMKFSSTSQTLASKLQQLAALAPSRLGADSLMAQMKMEAENGALKLTATDGELELSATVEEDVTVETDGQAYVPARQMASFYASLGAEEVVEVTSSEGATALKSKSSDLKLNAVGEGNIRLFTVEEVDEAIDFDFGRNELIDLVQKTAFAMASGDVRYYLNGMLLEVDEDEIRCVSTDAHRLAFAKKSSKGIDIKGFEGAEKAARACIMPRKAVQELTKLLSSAQDTIHLKMSKHRLVAEMGDYRLTCRLVDGRYPDYTKVIPKENDIKAIVERRALQATMRRAYIVAEDDPGKTVNLRFTPDWLYLEASSPQQHKINEKMPVQYAGDNEVKIAFNASYVLDFLNSTESENIQIELRDKESRTIMRGEGDENAFYLLMPVLL
ncbi:MAG: DNA polymerase III subunit beta [Gammaproteobacteria bacterium]|nr:DNA polymerase III subunit beta [Gammaproteobacteria bacterium]